MARKKVYLEDALWDDSSLLEGIDSAEQPLAERTFGIFSFVVLGICVAVAAYALYFGVVRGSFYGARAQANAGRQTVLEAPRGIIYDRYGTPLLSNEPTFNININLSEILKDKSKIAEKLAQLRQHLDFDERAVEEKIRSVDIERQAYYPLARNLSLAQVIELKKLDSKDIQIENAFIRKYSDPYAFSHVLGYANLVNQSDLEQNSDLYLNDEIGRTGLEAQYDALLRGTNGFIVSYKNAKGTAVEKEEEEQPIAGHAIITSLDAQLQKVFYESLSRRLKDLNRSAGAGIAIDPRTGEVLALISLPTYDNNKLSGNLFTDPQRPLFDRAISGVYSPGSTVKPMMGFAALEEGIVHPLDSIYSKGYIELPNPYHPDKPSRFLDWKAHGWVNLYSAIARSSDVYFYAVGGGFEKQVGLGIARIRQYWQKFFLDKKTGIDLPGEGIGFLPDPEWKEKRTGQIWRVGDTYNISIGQGDLVVTPIALLRHIAGIATRGKLPKLSVMKEIKDHDGAVVMHAQPSFDVIDTKDPHNYVEVEDGMLQTTEKDYGTAYMLKGLSFRTAAKTGSAQIQNNTKENAFFVGYGPVPDPQIAILILIEDAREGSLNSIPVALDVLNWYYEHRIKGEPIEETSATSTPTSTAR